VDDFSPMATVRYQQGWKALNRLLHEGRSFSGRERNCVFLNTGESHKGQRRFANISAVSGLDFPEDGRAVAACDWDFDGKLDLWITNRTAPRVRFLRNQNKTGYHFLAIRLQGDGVRTSRDAIGTRVEVWTTDTGPATEKPHIKTLYAGDAFLSQTSSWLHFGLGEATEIREVLIRWPGGETQRLSGLDVDRRYVIDQRTGRATLWNPPTQRKPLVAADPDVAVSGSQARIVLPTRLSLPVVHSHEHAEPLNERLTKPTVLCLWSVTCAPCLKELNELAHHADRLKQHGLDVVAINLDRLDGPEKGSDTQVPPLELRFRSEHGTLGLVKSLDAFQKSMFDRWEDLAVPTSILVDDQQRAAVIYRGAVGVDQLLADMALLDAPVDQLVDLATPFTGKWIATPQNTDPLRVTSQLIDMNMVSEGVAYLKRYAHNRAESALGRRNLGDVFHVMAILLRDQNQTTEAHAAFQQALEYNPDDVRVRHDYANVLAQEGQLAAAAEQLERALEVTPDDIATLRKLALLRMAQREFDSAIEAFERVVKEQPGDVAAQYNLANAFRTTGQIKDAVELYERILKMDSNMILAANNLAWIRATHPSATLRNGVEAVRLAEDLCQKTKFQQPSFLDTLAVAYAEAGLFEKAVQTAQRAITLATQAGDHRSAAEMRGRLELFEQKRPYRSE
jgi:tetratricopeptide (TPR) repeat protein